MKSRIRSAIPKKIIGINISSQKRDIIEDIAKSENAEAVFFDNEIMGQQVGYLCGFKGFERSEKVGEDIADECLIFSGIDGRSLDPILKKLREKGSAVELKAFEGEATPVEQPILPEAQSKVERWRAYKRAAA